jgi:DNA adenine methylase
MNRSPLFYVGDKFKLLKQIIPYFPNNINTYYEPFVGGGSSFTNVLNANRYILNDIDINIISIHKMFKDHSDNYETLINNFSNLEKKYNLSASRLQNVISDELKFKYPKTYFSVFNKPGYKKLKNDYNSSKNKSVKMLYLLMIYGFNRMIRFNSLGEFNLPAGNVDFNKNVEKSIKYYCDFLSKNDCSFHNLDYDKFIKNYQFKNGDFIYLDPPYLISSSEYNKLWSAEKEVRLLDLLDELNNKGVKFAISNLISHKGKVNSIFLEWSKKYKVIEVKSNYISYHDNTIKDSKEVLVINYEIKKKPV